MRSSAVDIVAELHRRQNEMYSGGSVDAVAELLAADIVWHVPGRNRLAGDVRGRDALFEWFERLRDVTRGTFHLEEHDVLGNGEHVVALSRMSAVRGEPIGVDVVSVFHYRDGRQVERWFLPADQDVWDRMFS